jgi:hypothetical protein
VLSATGAAVDIAKQIDGFTIFAPREGLQSGGRCRAGFDRDIRAERLVGVADGDQAA